ncbi:MAG: hypothetical protein KGL39_25020 [Patescibacteria group bacterium]|nr:hypothetical protein [Patescibacteria group bacterium]
MALKIRVSLNTDTKQIHEHEFEVTDIKDKAVGLLKKNRGKLWDLYRSK